MDRRAVRRAGPIDLDATSCHHHSRIVTRLRQGDLPESAVFNRFFYAGGGFLVVGRKVIRTGLVFVLALAAAGIFAMVGRADDPQFDEITSSMGPGIVDANSTVLVKASWHYIDNPTLNHSKVRFTIPDGWTLESAAPNVCSRTGTIVTCPRGTIRPDDVIAQAVELKTDSDQLDVLSTVEIDLLFAEGPENPGRTQVQPAPDVSTTVIAAGSATPNKVGKCVAKAGGTIGTDPGVGGSEASATVPATDELCTPFSISERPRQDPNEACLPGVECVLEIVTTESALFPATDPIELKIVFRGQGINDLPLIFTSEDRQIEVPECTDDAVAEPDPCFSGHRTRMQSVTWTVNWSGNDPGWTG
jgi:hypothetical protein